ncbi:hypothetical protein SUNI508_07665 [Seiridium unicorne]|uniref:Uncharacterized protein n=1 Tax=Seiridium unicorne TaxID=138068 RepID=A0ABR2UW43_9PEZI
MKLSSLFTLAAGVSGMRIPQARGGIEQKDIIRIESTLPVSEVGCHGNPISVTDAAAAKQKLVKWSDEGNRVEPHNMHGAFYTTAVWYTCNCKFFHSDAVPQEELDEAERLIEEKCGRGASGWVWSQDWDKTWTLQQWVAVIGKAARDVCPPHCVYFDIEKVDVT